MEKNDQVYVKHILDAISTIETFRGRKTYQQFVDDKLLQDGCVRELEIIGEAAKHISESFKNRFSDIQWKNIVGMRVGLFITTLVLILRRFGKQLMKIFRA